VAVVACVSIALPLLFYLHEHVEMLRCGYEIESLKSRRLVLVEKTRQLAADRAAAASVASVERRAEAMGLVAPAASDVLLAHVDDSADATGGTGVGGPLPSQVARSVEEPVPCEDEPQSAPPRVAAAFNFH
jgi:hypothetical protein